jgi:nucleotide-binding universal stress UspA family protein
MQTILVALDGSRPAGKALDIALDLAKQHKARVVLFHVLLRNLEPEDLLRLADLAEAGPALADRLQSLRLADPKTRTATEVMDNPGGPNRPVPETVLREVAAFVLKQGRAKAAKRRVRVEVLEPADGPAAQAIAAAAANAEAEVIVMGSRGLSQIDSFTFGSVSREVCRLAHCSCIAVH